MGVVSPEGGADVLEEPFEGGGVEEFIVVVGGIHFVGKKSA